MKGDIPVIIVFYVTSFHDIMIIIIITFIDNYRDQI